MKRLPLLALLPLLLLGACSRSATLVIVQRLAPGGGGAGTSDRAQFDVVVRLEADATGFNAPDLMRLFVDDVDRTADVRLGGLYGILRLDPPPVGLHTVELFTRTGPLLVDSFTWTVVPYTGPTIAGVAPASARAGAQVEIAGTGFDSGALRVFFGGVEGAVDASTGTAITATVPAGAVPGLVWVLVGDAAAEGIVEFQPLDASDSPVPRPLTLQIFAAFPGRSGVEVPVRIYGINFTDTSVPFFNDQDCVRMLLPETVSLPLIGDIVAGFAVPLPETPSGSGTLRLRNFGIESNVLPFRID